MTPDEVKNIAKDIFDKAFDEKIDDYATKNQAGVSKIPAHNHDGVSVSKVDANNLSFSVPYFKLVNLTSTPSAMIAGAVCSVSGTLYISNGTSWIKVGAQ